MSEKSPEFVDDGLVTAPGVMVYVGNAEDEEAGGLDVHIRIGESDDLTKLFYDPNIKLCNREELYEAWFDAYDALREQALKLNNLATWIFNHLDELSKEAVNGRA